MSGVYIPDIALPKEDFPLWIMIHKDGTVEYNADTVWRYGELKAIPVPDHGRLIEAERLKEVFHRNVVCGDAFDQLIDIAPTIFPADFAEDINVLSKEESDAD